MFSELIPIDMTILLPNRIELAVKHMASNSEIVNESVSLCQYLVSSVIVLIVLMKNECEVSFLRLNYTTEKDSSARDQYVTRISLFCFSFFFSRVFAPCSEVPSHFKIDIQMATPVVTDKWSGNFDCSICRRKRLIGSEFSKKALERFRKSGGPLKCKKCAAAQEEKEREAAAQKIELDAPSPAPKDPVNCSSCKKALDPSRFNRNQLSKKEKARCRDCVENVIMEEEKNRKTSNEKKLSDLQSKVEEMKVSGDVAGLVQAETELSAMEAEMVTGLKPQVLGRSGRGRYKGRGRGRL